MKYLDDSIYADNNEMIQEVMQKIREFMNVEWSDDEVDSFYMNHCYVEDEEGLVIEYEDNKYEYNSYGIYSAEGLKEHYNVLQLSDGNYLFIV